MNEFELIARYFTHPPRRAVLGIGDDCALIAPAPGRHIAISTDMLLEGRHFLPGADPEALGHKTLAVNLSDCAAVGAQPRYALLAGALPEADPEWLEAFARGFFALADRFDTEVIGGDTTKGPRTFCVTILGDVPKGEALLRSGARAGDRIWVSGELGAARLGLALLRGEAVIAPPADVRERALVAMHRPTPRIELGIALRSIATAAIDLSDGLLGDVGHILERSHAAAEIELETIPCGDWLRTRVADPATAAWAREFLLAGGDDYELCFTAPAGSDERVRAAGHRAGVPVTPIGRIRAGSGVTVVGADRAPVDLGMLRGFDHFA
jgi:thiamine-monophosphate kinase